jgi:histidine triad (HIT) family protein
MSCVFCRLASGELPASRVYEDADVLAFRDIHPQAPSHVLVISKAHLASLDELADPRLAGALLAAAVRVAQLEKLAQGWRLIANTGAHGGQEVLHLHLHVLGGRPLGRMLPAAK